MVDGRFVLKVARDWKSADLFALHVFGEANGQRLGLRQFVGLNFVVARFKTLPFAQLALGCDLARMPEIREGVVIGPQHLDAVNHDEVIAVFDVRDDAIPLVAEFLVGDARAAGVYVFEFQEVNFLRRDFAVCARITDEFVNALRLVAFVFAGDDAIVELREVGIAQDWSRNEELNVLADRYSSEPDKKDGRRLVEKVFSITLDDFDAWLMDKELAEEDRQDQEKALRAMNSQANAPLPRVTAPS